MPLAQLSWPPAPWPHDHTPDLRTVARTRHPRRNSDRDQRCDRASPQRAADPGRPIGIAEPHAQIVRCTNIRTVDGKRPTFISDPKGTFVFPWHLIRLLELPAAPTEAQKADTRVVVTPA